jgi:hypothetical protein
MLLLCQIHAQNEFGNGDLGFGDVTEQIAQMSGKKIVEFDLQDHLIRLQNRDHGLSRREKPCVEGPGAQILVQRDPGVAIGTDEGGTVIVHKALGSETLQQAALPQFFG